MENSIKEWEQNSQKVKEFGEVFTPDSIVMSMINLVNGRYKGATSDEYIDIVYLEPACGDGQFLVRLLHQKLSVIPNDYSNEQKELMLIKSLCSIYGVDIQNNNVKQARKRMSALATGQSIDTFDIDGVNTIKVDLGIRYSPRLKKLINWILERNIICGDTLDTSNPILLTGYEFKGSDVIIHESPINDLSLEIDRREIGNYMSLLNIANSCDNDNFDF